MKPRTPEHRAVVQHSELKICETESGLRPSERIGGRRRYIVKGGSQRTRAERSGVGRGGFIDDLVLDVQAELELMPALNLGCVVLEHSVIRDQPKRKLAAERITPQIEIADARPVERLVGVRKPEGRGIVRMPIARSAPVVITRRIQEYFIGHGRRERMH